MSEYTSDPAVRPGSALVPTDLGGRLAKFTSIEVQVPLLTELALLRRSAEQIACQYDELTQAVSKVTRVWQPTGKIGHYKFDVIDTSSLLPAISKVRELSAATERASSLVAPQLKVLQRQLRTYLSNIADLARWGPELARTSATWALGAALQARDAARSGRTEEVDEFIEKWLRQKPTHWRREAVVDVLLSNEWLPDDMNTPAEVVTRSIRSLATKQVRNLKPIWETEIRGRRIDSLDRTIYLPSGQSAPLGESVLTRPLHEPVIDIRLEKVMRQLSDRERLIVQSYALGSGNWADAALAVGAPLQAGESVRRKCKRVAAELRRRDAAIAS